MEGSVSFTAVKALALTGPESRVRTHINDILFSYFLFFKRNLQNTGNHKPLLSAHNYLFVY